MLRLVEWTGVESLEPIPPYFPNFVGDSFLICGNNGCSSVSNLIISYFIIFRYSYSYAFQTEYIII